MNGCVYRTDTDRCGLFTTETVTSFCPVNWVEKCPCRKQSNADRIRSMTDEEMAKYYFDAFFYTTPYCFKPECTDDDACEECLLNWLKQEAKDGE